MDFSTVIGLAMGVACVWYAFAAGEILGLIWDLPSFILVVGGTIASTMMTFPLSVMKDVPRSMWMTFFPKKIMSTPLLIARLCELAEVARVKGIDALPEKVSKDIPFIRMGVKMLLDEMDEDAIRESMEWDMESMLDRHLQVQKAFGAAGGYGPVYGLLGTLVGILGVLRYLDDPKKMGAAMTVAIVTTFYGIFIANFFSLPTASKLESYSSKELLVKQLVLIGILSMKKEETALMLQRKLEKHIAESLRKEK